MYFAIGKPNSKTLGAFGYFGKKLRPNPCQLLVAQIGETGFLYYNQITI
jgi:hypothetical protein